MGGGGFAVLAGVDVYSHFSMASIFRFFSPTHHWHFSFTLTSLWSAFFVFLISLPLVFVLFFRSFTCIIELFTAIIFVSKSVISNV